MIWVKAGIALLFVALAVSLGLQYQTIVTRTGERDRIITVLTEATVAPDNKGNRKLLTPEAALAAARSIVRERDNRTAVIERIDTTTKAAKTRDAAADVHLADQQSRNMREAARSSPVIAALEEVKPSGDAGVDNAAIDNASQAPWRNWETAK